MPLKLNGKPLDLNPPLPRIEKIAKFLAACPADEVFDAPTLAAKMNTSVNSIRDASGYELLKDMSEMMGRFRVYGCKKAIAELRRVKAEAARQ